MKKTLLAILISVLSSQVQAAKPTDAYSMTYLDVLAIYLNFGGNGINNPQGITTTFIPNHPATIKVEREIHDSSSQKAIDDHKKEIDNLFNLDTKLLDVKGVNLVFSDKKIKLEEMKMPVIQPLPAPAPTTEAQKGEPPVIPSQVKKK